jgi:hypothetical protein
MKMKLRGLAYLMIMQALYALSKMAKLAFFSTEDSAMTT